MLKDQNNPAVLGSIAEVLKKSQEVVSVEEAKSLQVAQEKYDSWRLNEAAEDSPYHKTLTDAGYKAREYKHRTSNYTYDKPGHHSISVLHPRTGKHEPDFMKHHTVMSSTENHTSMNMDHHTFGGPAAHKVEDQVSKLKAHLSSGKTAKTDKYKEIVRTNTFDPRGGHSSVKEESEYTEGWKVETEWKKSKPRSEKQAADAAHNLAGQGLKKEKELEKKAEKNVKEEVEQIDEKEYSMPYNSSKTTSAGDRYKHVIAHAKKMGYKVHHQDTAGDEKGDADITVRYQGGESRHSSDPESIEIHKGGKADKDKTAHAIAGGKATSMKNEEWEAIEEALDPRVAAAFQKVAKGVEVHMKHKETGKINVAKFPGGMNAVKAAKEHEAEMGKQGYEVHKRKIMEEKTLSAILDEARGRPRKNPAPAASKSDEDGDDYGPDKGPEADQNIQNHLKKAIDSNGEHHVKFADGSAHKVPAHVAHKVLSGLHKLKPEARAQAQDHIYQSHKNLMQVHKMLG